MLQEAASMNKIYVVSIEEHWSTHKGLEMEHVTEVFQCCGHLSASQKKITQLSFCALQQIILSVIFWVVTLCTLVGGNQRFRGPCCLHLQATWRNLPPPSLGYLEEEGSRFVQNIGNQLHGMVSQPRGSHSNIHTVMKVKNLKRIIFLLHVLISAEEKTEIWIFHKVKFKE
jgi:hypothetical protein